MARHSPIVQLAVAAFLCATLSPGDAQAKSRKSKRDLFASVPVASGLTLEVERQNCTDATCHAVAYLRRGGRDLSHAPLMDLLGGAIDASPKEYMRSEIYPTRMWSVSEPVVTEDESRQSVSVTILPLADGQHAFLVESMAVGKTEGIPVTECILLIQDGDAIRSVWSEGMKDDGVNAKATISKRPDGSLELFGHGDTSPGSAVARVSMLQISPSGQVTDVHPIYGVVIRSGGGALSAEEERCIRDSDIKPVVELDLEQFSELHLASLSYVAVTTDRNGAKAWKEKLPACLPGAGRIVVLKK